MALNWYIHYTTYGYLNHAKNNIMNSISDKNIQKGYESLNVPLEQSIADAKAHLLDIVSTTKREVAAQDISDLLTMFKYGFKSVTNSQTIEKVKQRAGEDAVKNFQNYFSENYLKYVSTFDPSKGGDESINLLGFTGQHKITDKTDTKLYKSLLVQFINRFRILNNALNTMLKQGQISKEALSQKNLILNNLKQLGQAFRQQAAAGDLIKIGNNDMAIDLAQNPQIYQYVTEALDAYNNLVYKDITTASASFQGEAFEDFAGILSQWLKGIMPQIEIQSKRLTGNSKANMSIVGKNSISNPIIEIDNILSTSVMESMKDALGKRAGVTGTGLEKKYYFNPGQSQGTVDVQFSWPFANGDYPPLNLSLKNYRKGLGADLSLIKNANLLSILNLTNNSFISHYANLSSMHYSSYPDSNESNGPEQALQMKDGGTKAGKFIKQLVAIRGLVGVRDRMTIDSNNLAEYFVVDDAVKKKVYVFSTAELGKAILQSTNLNGLTINGLIEHNKIRIIYKNSWIKGNQKKQGKNWGLARVRNTLFLQYVVSQNVSAKINLSSFLATNKLTP